MSNKKNKLAIPTNDSVRYKKDCHDFTCLVDGTITGDCRYCNLSTKCKQVDIVDGKAVSMASNYCSIIDPVTGELLEFEYYCTGVYDKRSKAEKLYGDDKVS